MGLSKNFKLLGGPSVLPAIVVLISIRISSGVSPSWNQPLTLSMSA